MLFILLKQIFNEKLNSFGKNDVLLPFFVSAQKVSKSGNKLTINITAFKK